MRDRWAMLDRRSLLGGIAAAGVAGGAHAQPALPPIIDGHIHLYDPNRPQGAPYAGPPNSPTHKTGAFPAGFRKLAGPLGIVGAVVVEASPWVEDNLWVLEVSATDSIIVGYVGNLRPEADEFPEFLARYHKNPLFRGIRYGNLWGHDLVAASRDRQFLDRLKLLAQADLSLDAANPTVDLLNAIVRVSDAAPDLRIVIDHLPLLEPAPQTAAGYDAVLAELRQRPNVFCKLSAIIHEAGGAIRTDLETHRPRLDRLYEVFGEDRVIFGSDWPNSDGAAPIEKVVGIAKAYFASKTRQAQEKYFWRNALRAYKWVRRAPDQPGQA